MYYFTKVWDGGQTNVDKGRRSGILFIIMNSWDSISLKFNLCAGSFFKQLEIKLFAASDIWTVSGNWYYPAFIFLYVYLTSDDSKGGLPIIRVYKITPIDHKSTS